MVWLFNRVEIIVANGEIPHYEQLLLLPQWFQMSSAAQSSQRVYMWDRVKNEEDNIFLKISLKLYDWKLVSSS